MFLRKKKVGDRTYLQIVENHREDGKPRQRVLITLGRLEQLQDSGQLSALVRSASRMCEDLLVLGETQGKDDLGVNSFRVGAPMLFERLWSETGCARVLRKLAAGRKFSFAVERAIFMTVLHRLMAPGSDRAACEWRRSYRIPGTEELGLHHLYRAMAWLGEELPENEQHDRTPYAPRCTKDLVEEDLFARRQELDLFSSLDVVFFDTTSVYFEGEGGDAIGRRGHSKDHRPDLKQMIVGVVLDQDGVPVCCEMWPGNTTDVTTLVPVVNRLQKRFRIGQVCIVADRGMISRATVSELEKRGWLYILGSRMRSDHEVRKWVLSIPGRYREVTPERSRSKDPSPLKVKNVVFDGRRYVVCLNEEQRRKDRADRQAILAALREKVNRAGTELVGNRGFRRYLSAEGSGFTIDIRKVREDARFDGKWVLRTNADFDTAEIALRYKQLWTVEETIRTAKSLLETRPIFHKCDETIRGHVFCSFLALVIRKELQDRLQQAGHRFEWADVLRDLDHLVETDLMNDGKAFRLRSETRGTCGRVFQAVGVALPPTVRRLAARESGS